MGLTSGVIGTLEMRARLTDPKDSFNVSPLPESRHVRSGSINLRLGRTFLVARRGAITAVAADQPEESERAFEELRLATGELLILHPRQFVLAVTQEYLSLPPDLCGFIQSRSTYGRMGLIAATATYVNPGYLGCPTLEIVNEGEVPISVAPGEPICQLILLRADEDETTIEPSRYHCAVRPYPPRPSMS